MDMKQVFGVIAGVVGFLLIIGVAFSIGQILTLKNEVATYQDRLATLEKNGGAATSKLKVGVVRVNDIALRLQDDPKFKDQFEQQGKPISDKLIALKHQNDAGTLSDQAYADQATPLNNQLQQLFQEILLRPIQNAVNQVGSSGNYDLVVKVEDVVLFAQHNIMEDITDKIWSQIQASK
ncbi:OmpH family outer membrane protein [Candidatus Acetothermia bacterium]|nr:OmpH family outer membrane protein [Candidatus Acetothermia bacterium]MBI3642519.1 OmpH family outer membrane protein [Candidatus Acetothermia bacterium]